MAPVRIAILDIIPTPYRLPLYRMLASSEGYDIRLYFCAETEPLRWGSLELEFPHRVLPGISLTRGANVHTYYLNPGIIRAIRGDRPDVLVVAGWVHPTCLLAMAAAGASRTPYIITSESHALRTRSLAARIARSVVFAPAVRRSAACLATGTRAREYLIRLGARPEAVFIRPNACDVESVAEAADAARGNGAAEKFRGQFPRGVPIVAFVGRLLASKGVDLLLTAVRQLLDAGTRVACLIGGDGPERPRLERQARELGLEDVRFVGMLEPSAVAEVYAGSDVFCLPSREEPWGVVVNEAMAAGLPVVASDAVGAAADLVQPGVNGEIFEAGNASALATALAIALALDSERAGASSRQLVAGWGYEAALEGFRSAVDEALQH